MITYDEDLKIFTSSLINRKGFFSGFGTKVLGDAKRHINNIFQFFSQNEINYNRIVIPEQIHSSNIEIYKPNSNDDIEKIPDVDGVISTEKNSVLTVVTADCLPIIFLDDKNGIFGISHQGWRSSVKRLAQKMVKKLVEVGAVKNSIKVAMGPSIGECCYDVDEERYYEFREEFDGYSEKIFHLRGGKWHLNLPLLNYLQLVNTGIKTENIDHFPFCTKCDKKRFFSFRRDSKKEFGEMFSFIIKNKD